MDYTLYNGDCLDVLPTLADNSIDSIVCDPPYELGFMGKAWDNSGIAYNVEVWRECLRVLKPGGHLLAFGGSRTYHRLACAVEDAGFEIRDQIMWVYGSGFPKSANISKMIDKQEQNRWLYVCKAIDNFDKMSIINEWKKYSRSAKCAALTLPKNQIETGTSTPKNDFVRVSAMPPVSQEKSLASVIIAELNSSEAHHTQADTSGITALSNVGEKEKPALAKSAESQQRNHQAKLSITGIVQCNVRESLNGRTVDNLRGVEALKIWLGKSKSSKQVDTNALCAALTDDLKRIILSQSKTFLSLDTTQQTDFASAINVTITESTAESLISYTVDTLRREAIDKAAGAEREVIESRKQQGNGGYQKQSPHNQHNGKAIDGRSTELINERLAQPFAITAPATPEAQQWDGWGTALKPSHEPIVVARKPLAERTVAANVLEWGTGAINVDGCRIPAVTGAADGRRWPANLIHDGSDEVLAGFPEVKGKVGMKILSDFTFSVGDKVDGAKFASQAGLGDTGSAARFFYCAKASKADRNSGLDGTCTVKYNIDKSNLILSGGLSWKNVCAGLVQSLQKATSGIQTVKWLIDESGESITGLCPLDSLSTTLTEISRITTSEILNLLTPSLTSAFIPAVNSEMANGGNPVGYVENSSPSIPTTGTSQRRGGLNTEDAENVISELLLAISDGENWKQKTNIHSTVKPTDLMRYLCRLVTPPGGLILDPFCGSGSTGKAAILEWFCFVGIDQSAEYLEIAKRRIEAAQMAAGEFVDKRGKAGDLDGLPMFN